MTLQWTRSTDVNASVYKAEDIASMWRTAPDGSIVYGTDDKRSATLWAMLALKPTDIFQLQVLNKWLVDYHNSLDYFSPYGYNFRWSVSPLRFLERDYYNSVQYKHVYYWNAELEIAWQSLSYSVYTEWNAGLAYRTKTMYTGEWEDGSYDHSDPDYQDCLSKKFWHCD